MPCNIKYAARLTFVKLSATGLIINKDRRNDLPAAGVDMSKNIPFIGMNVHKDSIEIAIAAGLNQEIHRYGKNGSTRDAMRKMLRKRDAVQLARLFQAGDLRLPFYVTSLFMFRLKHS